MCKGHKDVSRSLELLLDLESSTHGGTISSALVGSHWCYDREGWLLTLFHHVVILIVDLMYKDRRLLKTPISKDTEELQQKRVDPHLQRFWPLSKGTNWCLWHRLIKLYLWHLKL